MLVKTFGSTLIGIHAVTITVEVSIDIGVQFFMVGLPDSAVRESHQRIEAALRHNGHKIPGKKIVIITDVCLCGFTDHGHCGILHGLKIDRKCTLSALGRISVSHAEAGADFVGPSAMTVGQVKAVRSALDRAGYSKTRVWAYAVKYASAYYGPFRGALGSTPKFGDRKGYQRNPGDSARGVRAALRDQKDGAAVLMVKPALPYLDIIFRLKQKARVPVAAYHVSGEYGMLKRAARDGVFDEKATVLETLLAIRRAGAGKIITYYAGEVAKWLKRK